MEQSVDSKLYQEFVPAPRAYQISKALGPIGPRGLYKFGMTLGTGT